MLPFIASRSFEFLKGWKRAVMSCREYVDGEYSITLVLGVHERRGVLLLVNVWRRSSYEATL